MANGRPTKLTPDTHDKIVKLMRAGNYFETACRAAGVNPGTGYRWKRWGRGEEVPGFVTPRSVGIYRKFGEACARAEGEAEAEAVLHVRKALPNDPKLALDYLERRSPQRWGRQVTEHRGEIDVEVEVTGPVVDALEKYNAVLDELARDKAEAEETPSDES